MGCKFAPQESNVENSALCTVVVYAESRMPRLTNQVKHFLNIRKHFSIPVRLFLNIL